MLEREGKGGVLARSPCVSFTLQTPFPLSIVAYFDEGAAVVCVWAAADKQSLLFSVRKTTNLAFMSCTVLAPDIGPGVTT